MLLATGTGRALSTISTRRGASRRFETVDATMDDEAEEKRNTEDTVMVSRRNQCIQRRAMCSCESQVVIEVRRSLSKLLQRPSGRHGAGRARLVSRSRPAADSARSHLPGAYDFSFASRAVVSAFSHDPKLFKLSVLQVLPDGDGAKGQTVLFLSLFPTAATSSAVPWRAFPREGEQIA